MSSTQHCQTHCVYPYPGSKGKKYQSYQELLFERQVCDYLDRRVSNRNYYDTVDRLRTLHAKNLYQSKIPRRRRRSSYQRAGTASRHGPYLFPGMPPC